MTQILELIISETQHIITNKGNLCPAIDAKTHFLNDLPMDSLDLATLIVSLEDSTQRDPFRDGFKSFHTVGELAELYESIT
jgi:acyl carrier protein